MFTTPILLIIFNRPALTSRILDSLKKIEATNIFVAADGARKNNDSDTLKCEQTRALIDEKITWDCNVKKLYRDKNLGCGKAVSDAITWFFNNNEYGIILEDDCLPDETFYSFCEHLLLKYKNNPQIMHIGGSNFQNGIKRGDASYYFSSEVHVWGWASWRRAWNNYDFNTSQLNEFIAQNKISKYYDDKNIINYWISIFVRMQKHDIDTWDYQWRYSIWNAGGLAIIPQVNLIANIGFGDDATHTFGNSPYANMAVSALENIYETTNIVQNKAADNYTFSQHYKPETIGRTFLWKLVTKAKKLLK